MDGFKRKLKHILIATDFSQTSDFALTRGIEIARQTKAKVTLLHVVQKKNMDDFLDNVLNKILPKGLWLTTEEYKKEIIQEKLNALSASQVNINQVVIPSGKPSIKILQYARKTKADLLIIGAHGKYSIRDSVLGTTAEYIAKKTKCPVLIVKNPAQKAYRKILVPVDFSPLSVKAFHYAMYVFPSAGVQLINVADYEYEKFLQNAEKEHVSKNKISNVRRAILFYLEDKMQQLTKGYHKRLKKHPYQIVFGQPGPTLLQTAKKINPDLIIMGTQGHGRMHYLFIGRVANWILTGSNKDVLLIPPSK